MGAALAEDAASAVGVCRDSANSKAALTTPRVRSTCRAHCRIHWPRSRQQLPRPRCSAKSRLAVAAEGRLLALEGNGSGSDVRVRGRQAAKDEAFRRCKATIAAKAPTNSCAASVRSVGPTLTRQIDAPGRE